MISVAQFPADRKALQARGWTLTSGHLEAPELVPGGGVAGRGPFPL